ncbi:MAG: hypothetical protein ACI4J1_03005 [Ruminiclostridium sp.]
MAVKKNNKVVLIICAVVLLIAFIFVGINKFSAYDYMPISDSTGLGRFENREYISEKLGFKIDFHGSWITRNEDEVVSDFDSSEKAQYDKDRAAGFYHILRADTPNATAYLDAEKNADVSPEDFSADYFNQNYAESYKAYYDDLYGVSSEYSTIKAEEIPLGGRKIMYYIYAYNVNGNIGGYIEAMFEGGGCLVSVYAYFEGQKGADDAMNLILHKISAV